MSDYPGIEAVSTAHGEDHADKSYREAQGLMSLVPDLDAIIAPTSVGIVAAAQAVSDADKVGQVNVTGLGLPSEMAGHVASGASKSFAIWNPIDLGYSDTMLAYELVKGAQAAPGASIPIGRMGELELDDNPEGAMADPFTYDASNIFPEHAPRGRFGLIDKRAMRIMATALLEAVGEKLDPRTWLRDLGIASKHLVAIARALSIDARVVITDEPTAALSQKEIEELYALIDILKRDGKAILFISHVIPPTLHDLV